MNVIKTKNCLNCGNKFDIREMPYPSLQKRENGKKYCSPVCARQYGLKRSWKRNKTERLKAIKGVFDDPVRGPEVRRKMSEWQKGPKAPHWKGNDATYNSIHRWIQKHWKRTGICEFCGDRPKPRKNSNSKHGTEWANKSDNYDRNNKDDWLELCSGCHKIFDKAKKTLK